MRAAELVRRAAGKSPSYLVRRGLIELARIARSRHLRRQLEHLRPAEVARQAGCSSLFELWRTSSPSFLIDETDRRKLQELYRETYATEAGLLKNDVEKVLAHEFDLLGSGPTCLGPEIDWHLDFKSGRRWEVIPSLQIDCAELDRPSDVKVPWELSRGQHLTTLGRAWVTERDERCVREFEHQIRSWIESNPPGLGVNWACAMEVALRAVTWIWALALFQDAPLSKGFWEEILCSLYGHGWWISENMEKGQVNGNHYLCDALGLAACGTVFCRTPAGRRWLQRGAQILEQEIHSQVGADGVDIEASVPYHRLVLEAFLVGARLLKDSPVAVSKNYLQRVERMFEFVDAYITPEGLSPVIGDADNGRVLVLGHVDIRDHRYLLSTGCVLFERGDWKQKAGCFWEDSLWLLGPSALDRFASLAALPPQGSRCFVPSGFCVLRSPRQYLFIDAGPVGFCGLGGHGHNDCLSFEWHVDGQPLLVDSGSYVYTASVEWRNRFRSAEFHSTVRVDGQEINRFRSPLALWSLKDDARTVGVGLLSAAKHDTIKAHHTGYHRLSDPVTVFRSFEIDRSVTKLRLIDRVDGRDEHLVEFFFHAAPGARAQLASETAEFQWTNGSRLLIDVEAGLAPEWKHRQGWFSPSYGIKVARPVWVASVRTKLPLEMVWKLTADVSLQVTVSG